MEENLHPDNLEQFFKDNLNESDLDPQGDPDGWDMPSNDVWKGIAPNIVKPVSGLSPTRLLWVKGAAIGTAILIAITGVVLYVNDQALNDKLAKQEEIIKDLQDQLIQTDPTKPQDSPNQHTEDKTLLKTDSDSSDENNPSKSSVLIDSSSFIIAQAESKLKPTIKPSPGQTAGSSSLPKKAKRGKSTPPLNELPNARASQLDQANNDIIPQDKNEDSNPLKRSTEVQKKEEALKSNAEQLAWGELPIIETSKPTFINTTSTEAASISPLQELRRKTFSSRWSITAFISPTKLVQGPTNEKRTSDLPRAKFMDQIDEASTTLEFGGFIGYQFARNWNVQLGFSQLEYTSHADFKYDLIYDSNEEMAINDRELESIYALSLSTAFGEAEVIIPTRRPRNEIIPFGDKIPVHLELDQTLQITSVPAQIQWYFFQKNRWRFGAKLGGAYNLIETTTNIKQTRISNPRHRLDKVKIRQSQVENKSSNWDYLVGLHGAFHLNRSFAVVLEPTLRGNITDALVTQKGSQNLQSMGVYLGLQYSF